MTTVRVRFTPNNVPTPGQISFIARHDTDNRPIVSGRDILDGNPEWEPVSVEGADVEVRPNDPGWHYVVRVKPDGHPQKTGTFTIPPNGPINFGDLVRYDPKAGMAYEPDPNWYAHLSAVENGINGVQADLHVAVDQATTAARDAADNVRGEVSADATLAATSATQAGTIKNELEQVFLGGTEAVNDAAVSTYLETEGTATRGALKATVATLGANVREFGAVGDGVTNDTAAIAAAYAVNGHLVFPAGYTFRIASDFSITKDTILDGHGATITSDGSMFVASSTANRLTVSGLTLDGVAIRNTHTAEESFDLALIGATVKNTAVYGLYLQYLNTLTVERSTFDTIGTSSIIITYQGCGIRVDRARFVHITSSTFTRTRGTGAIVLRGAKSINVTGNVIVSPDYRGIALADPHSVGMAGFIANNEISRCGIDATAHSTGVGCNGLYANNGDFSNVVVRGNTIRQVAENGIEGTFGLVEGNIVDGTGFDPTGHPSPDASGINLYGKVYRNNIVRNSQRPAYFVFDNVKADGTGVTDLTVEGNIAENSGGGFGLAVLAASYTNVKVSGNRLDKPSSFLREGLSNVAFSDNRSETGDVYGWLFNTSEVKLLDPPSGVISRGFAFPTDTSLSGFTLYNATVAKQTATEGGFTYYYPQVTNDGSTFGRLEYDITTRLPRCYLIVNITYSGNSIRVSYAPKGEDGAAGTSLFRTLDTGTDVTKQLIYNVEGASRATLNLRVGNSAPGAVGVIKKFEVSYIAKT